jgi:hypothetical protein
MRWSCLAMAMAIGCSGSSDKGVGGGGGSTGMVGGAGGIILGGDASAGSTGGMGPGGLGGSSGAPGTGGTGGTAVGGVDAGGAVVDGPAQSPDGGVTADATTLSSDAMQMMGPSPDGSVVLPADGPSPAMDTAPVLAPDAAPLEPDAAPPSPDVAAAPPDTSPDSAPLTADGPSSMADAGPQACTPLTCPDGTFCSAATHTCLVTSGHLHFTFQDSCAVAGPSVGLRLFDETHGGVWPANTNNVFVLPYAQSQTVDIACIPGANICYGANSTGGSIFWGVSVNNDRVCTGCCVKCELPENVQPLNLTCN